MSSLKSLEKRQLEDLLGSASGYVLDFTNASFEDFFLDGVAIQIYSKKYSFNGESKGKHLRAFWEVESDELVGDALIGLLEHWLYLNPDKNKSRYEACVQIAMRLRGNDTAKETTPEDFLAHDFGKLELEKLPIDSSLVPILAARLAEANRCLANQAPLAVIFLCGSVLEGAMLGAASNQPELFNRSKCSPKDDAGKPVPFHKWSLNDLINVACDVEVIKIDVKKFSHVLRDFRNYIHPYQQMVSKFEPDEHTAKICMQVLRAALADLSGAR